MLKQSQWELPKECGDKAMLMLAGRGPVILSDPEVSAILFKRFRKIRTIEQARAWRKNFGVLHPGIGAGDDVWKLARTIQWVCNFFALVKYEEVPFIRKALKRTSRLQKYCSRITEEEFYALQDRIYSDDGKSMREGVSNQDVIDWLAYMFAEQRPNEGSCSFPPPSHYGTPVMYKLSNDFLRVEESFIAEIHYDYVEIEYKDLRLLDDDEELLRAAREFLANVLNHLLGNLRVSIELDSNAQLKQSVSQTSPWEAILSELLRLVSGKAAPRKCKYDRCGKVFVPSRADQLYCGNPACRQSVSRLRKKQHA